METPKVFESEYRFCLIMWEAEPVSCVDLAKLCNKKLGWSRTTTYTVISRLCERGVLKKENSIVTSLYSKEQIQVREFNELFDKTFEGSLPSFITAFAKSRHLSKKDEEELRKIIEHAGEDD